MKKIILGIVVYLAFASPAYAQLVPSEIVATMSSEIATPAAVTEKLIPEPNDLKQTTIET